MDGDGLTSSSSGSTGSDYNPLVSILIPAYNAADFLAETLESALAQTYNNKEIILVDDASSDETSTIARRVDGGHGKIQIVNLKRNCGTAHARNLLLSLSKGAFIQFLDHDDVISSEKIQKQVDLLLKAPPNAICSCAWSFFGFNEAANHSANTTAPDWHDYDRPIEWILDAWTGRGNMPTGAWLIPRRLIEQCGPWRELLTFNDDTEYLTRIVLASSKIVFCSEARYGFRVGHPSLSSGGGVPVEQRTSHFDVTRLCVKRLLEFEESERTRHASACLWQGFLYFTWPMMPELTKYAEQRIHQLGGGSLSIGVCKPFVSLRDKISWKMAARLSRIYVRLRRLLPTR